MRSKNDRLFLNIDLADYFFNSFEEKDDEDGEKPEQNEDLENLITIAGNYK